MTSFGSSVAVTVALVASTASAIGGIGRVLSRRAVRRRCAVAVGRPARSLATGWQRLVRRLATRRARDRPRAAVLAALLDDIARRSASGHSLTASFLAAAGAGPIDEIASVASRMQSGHGFDESLDAADVDDPDVGLTVHVLRLCASQGGNITESLDRAAATLRERQAVADERVAQAGQARLSAQVLTVVPMVFAGWTVLTTASVQRFVVSPIGVICVTLGVAFNLAGWGLMRRAIEGAGWGSPR